MLLFPKLKKQLDLKLNSHCNILNNNIDELKNSKIFRNSEIEILQTDLVAIKEKPLEHLYVSEWTRVMGKIYIHSVCFLFNGIEDIEDLLSGLQSNFGQYLITGYFNECKISNNRETALKLDRLSIINQLDKLNKLDI